MDEKLQECLCPVCPSYVKCDEPLACIPEVHIINASNGRAMCLPGMPVFDKLKLTASITACVDTAAMLV